MKCRIPIAENHVFECHLSSWSGAERYLLDGREILRQRSFKSSGQRRFDLNIDGRPSTIELKVRFQPGWHSLWNSSGMVAELRHDGEVLTDDLMRPPYRQLNPVRWLSRCAVVVFVLLIAAAFIDGRYLAGRLLGPGPDDLPTSLQIINAAVAPDACRDALRPGDESLLLSRRDARELRKQEMQRRETWGINDHDTALSVIAAIYEMQPPACRQAMMQLMDRYLAQGADINQRFGTREMTVLEGAVLGGDADLSCELLRRGASLNQRVRARLPDRQAAPITGVTLDVLAARQAERLPHDVHTRTLKVINDYKNTGSCETLGPDPESP